MPTYFFEIRPQLLTAHRQHFKAKHQTQRPGNELAIFTNVAGDALLVKVNCDEPFDQIVPQGLTPHATYNLEQAKALLQTPEWRHPSLFG